MEFNLSPKKILKILLYFILFMLVANILVIISGYYFGHYYIFGLANLFDFNTEQNIPTFYSSTTLFIVSILLWFIALSKNKEKASFIPWIGLSLIFLFLSIDEILTVHENLTGPTRRALNTSGLLYYAWIIPYGLALVFFITFYLKFLLKLPKNIMILFLTSGSTFVIGAIGFEMLGGRQAELYGESNILYFVFYTCEELLEMTGIAMFLYTLLMYIVNEIGPINITINKKNIK